MPKTVLPPLLQAIINSAKALKFHGKKTNSGLALRFHSL